jgi:prepilin signal peptidase PulO-like enzyme (type II secretory pathway)
MIYVLIVIFGLALGSFVNAFVWRLHEQSKIRSRHSRRDRESSKKIDFRIKSENDRLKDLSITKGRSMCIHCGHKLSWKDLIPVISWLTLRGKCRYCKKDISWQYPIVELASASLLTLSFYVWPLPLNTIWDYALFDVWTALFVVLMILFVYDMRWMILPTKVVHTGLALSVFFVGSAAAISGDSSLVLSSAVGSVLLGGLFWLIYQISKGKWIGGGDVRLGFAMGLFLGWQKVILGLSLAAYIGTAIVIVTAILGKYHKRMKLPFGPLLIAGWYIAFLWGQILIDLYLGFVGL